MTRAIQIHPQDNEPDVELVAERLTHLLPSLLADPVARDEAKGFLPMLKNPADPVWVMARVASLLNPYFEKDTPQAIREMEAEDWAYAFESLPKWAIDRAVRWWKSADNPKRRGRPVEGDIVDRVRVEMKCVRDAEAGFQLANAPNFKRKDPPKVWEPLTDAQKAEADALVAPFVKRMPGHKGLAQ